MSLEIIGGVIAIILAASKVLDYFKGAKIDKRIAAKLDIIMKQNRDIDKKVDNNTNVTVKLWDVHNVKDETGMPIWYVPKKEQTEILTAVRDLKEVIHEISQNQKLLIQILDKIT